MKRVIRKIVLAVAGIALLAGSMPVQALAVENGAVYSVATNAIEGWPQGPEMYAETAVLMDAETGAVLFDKGMDQKRYPASITKVMTALLALENSSLSDQVVFTEECLQAQASDSTNIGMKVGEVLTMEQCLMALMIKSANDVAIQIAVQVSGSVPAFAERMNQRAKELGCENTNFVNPNGLPDENHYTTAHDMALIFREAIKNEEFKRIIATLSYTIEPTNMTAESRTFSTHHALSSPAAPEYYEGCIGGKTGNTQASRCTLVSGAQRNGMTLIAVAMRAEAGQVCQDHIRMFNYGFENFKREEVPGGSVILPVGQELSGLELRETESGEGTRQSYYYQGYLMGSGLKEEPVPEVTQEPQTLFPETADEVQKEPETEKEAPFSETLLYLSGALICVVLLILLIAGAARKKKRKKSRKKKNRKK